MKSNLLQILKEDFIMGLDMYLNRMPRYKNATASEVSAIENYFDWMKAKKEL